jgi:hypothetical protein
MCIYCGTNRYRKIYENHYGEIPKDETGRSYEIHHIDGNHSNNDPTNLTCITIQEHFDIHKEQKDYGACFLIGQRMKLSPMEISALSINANNQRIQNGTHNWLNSDLQKRNAMNRVTAGTHHFLGGEHQRKQQRTRIQNGTHNFLQEGFQKAVQSKLVEDGIHHFLGGEQQRQRVKDGTHHLLGGEHQRKQLENGTHPTQKMKICDHCDKSVSSPMFSRWHGDKCRHKK